MTEPSATVYSYYTPEIRNTVQVALTKLNFGAECIHDILKQNCDPGLDDLHLPLMEKYEAFARSEGVIGLENFDSKYFTNGSSEGIFHLIQGCLPDEPLYQFDGEYQGYQAFADACGRRITTLSLDADAIEHARPGLIIMSNPASMDGNIVSPHFFEHILNNHRVILDLAYMGMTQKPLNLDTTNENIVAVVGSLSKPFGMYYYRIGFCYTRGFIASLYGNKWFKNALSIKLGEAVLDNAVGPKWQVFKDKYFELQAKAVRDMRSFVDPMLPTKASDVWLLAYNAQAKLGDKCEAFKRTDDVYRFCLTPYYMEQS